MRDYKQLQVWQKSHELSIAVYRITAGMPREEIYGLTSQMRRASVSVPANIAEGCGRTGEAELARFMSIAMGSASELEYYCMLCRDLRMLKAAECEHLIEMIVEVKRMLTAFVKKLKERKND